MGGDEVNYLNFLSGTGDMWKRIFEPFLSLKKISFFFLGEDFEMACGK